MKRGAKYEADKPCKKCGGHVRYVRGSHCVYCITDDNRDRRDYMRAYARKRRANIKKALATLEELGPKDSKPGEVKS
jgi:hypothetical protein